MKDTQNKRIRDKEIEAKILFHNIKESLPELSSMLKHIKSEQVYENTMYAFYHKEKRLLEINTLTFLILKYLESLQPDSNFTNKFLDIVECASSNKSRAQINRRWGLSTRPLVEAFMHAKYFLEVVVESGETLAYLPKDPVPNHWSSVLSFYNLK